MSPDIEAVTKLLQEDQVKSIQYVRVQVHDVSVSKIILDTI